MKNIMMNCYNTKLPNYLKLPNTLQNYQNILQLISILANQTTILRRKHQEKLSTSKLNNQQAKCG